uniref:Uncharacterized protein n=1 Tax=Ascaris lumbricoides TaxID=6252 RepID=A0A0M3I701_ASCLU
MIRERGVEGDGGRGEGGGRIPCKSRAALLLRLAVNCTTDCCSSGVTIFPSGAE